MELQEPFSLGQNKDFLTQGMSMLIRLLIILNFLFLNPSLICFGQNIPIDFSLLPKSIQKMINDDAKKRAVREAKRTKRRELIQAERKKKKDLVKKQKEEKKSLTFSNESDEYPSKRKLKKVPVNTVDEDFIKTCYDFISKNILKKESKLYKKCQKYISKK